MIRTLTEKEIKEFNKKMNEWWLSLDWGMKIKIFKMFEHLIENPERWKIKT